MNNFYSGLCPACGGKLQTIRLSCSECGAEYPINASLSPYSRLSEDQNQFLSTFLKCRGNLKAVGEIMHLSYPTVKKRFDDLLLALGYLESKRKEMEKIDMSILKQIDSDSRDASEIIKRKLYESGGDITISLLDGKPCRIVAQNDGVSFVSDKLNDYKIPYEYTVFNCIVELLKVSKDGRASKGNAHGREDKVGYGKCTPDTVVGTIAINYFHRRTGESTLDPVFVLAAMLDWAGIAKNCRGYIELTNDYRSLLSEEHMVSSPALAQRFENELREKALEANKKYGYNPKQFLSMIGQFGGVETAKKLIHNYASTGRFSDGYEKLWEFNRLDLTMEASVIKPEYQELFQNEEIICCRTLLEISNRK